MNTNEKTPFTIYCNKLHSVLRKSALFIEPNNDSNIDSQLCDFLNEHFKYGEYARPTMEIGEINAVIAIPKKEGTIDLSYWIRIFGFEQVKYSYWKKDYESYLISARKYPYIEWCIHHQEYEKLFIYLQNEYVEERIKTAIKINNMCGMLIAIPNNCIDNICIVLINKLRELGFDAVYSFWDKDDESYNIALKKYSYIERYIIKQQWKKLERYIKFQLQMEVNNKWCTNNQQWKKLVQYIKKAF